MKRSNLYLVLFIGIVAGVSILNGGLSSLNEDALIKDQTYFNRYPTSGDLFILKDTGDFRTFFKIRENIGQDKFSIIYGNKRVEWSKINWEGNGTNYAWFRQAIEEDLFFDLTKIEEKTNQEIKALLFTDKLEDNAVYRFGENRLITRIFYSYLGFLIIVLFAFLVAWFFDAIGIGLNRIFGNIPPKSGFYLLTLLGMLIAFRAVNFPLIFAHSWVAVMFGLLGFLPVAILYHYLNRKYFHNLGFADTEAGRFAVLFIGGIAFYLAGFLLSNILEGALGNPTKPEYFEFNVVLLLHIAFLIWTAIATGNFLNNLRKHFLKLRKQESKLKESQKNELASQAELDALQARINPHFLYNSLNSIASLAQIDPSKTEAMAMALSKFYKYSTNRKDEHLSSISEEIEMLKTYLEIEEIRFGERLQFEINYQKSDFAWRIPRFLLQPIVENAIKHGYNKTDNNIKILIEVKETVDSLEISIFDNGTAFPENMTVGYGLRSVQKKLKLLFPEKHQFEFVNAPKKYVLIRIAQ